MIETKRLEHEADAVHRSAISRLFGEETDAITIIKWKEIFDFLEDAVDRCDKVAVVIEGVVVKHSYRGRDSRLGRRARRRRA